MEKRLLWFFVIALLGSDILLLVQRKQTGNSWSFPAKDEKEVATALTKTAYADEEEAMVTRIGRVPLSFPGLHTNLTTPGAVQFFLLASVNDCTNSIEDEVLRLNELAVPGFSRNISGVRGFFVDEDRPKMVTRLIAHLSPRPLFPMVVNNALLQLPNATTPIVLVVRSSDGKILDAHKPIPEDLTKRDTFYSRWNAILSSKLFLLPRVSPR